VSATVDIAAPVDEVWAVVSDLTRMGEWSPECRRVLVVGRPRAGVGTRLLGINRRGPAVWPTLSRVVRHEPERAIAWRVRESAATWSYELAPVEGGTRLTARRELAAYSPLTRVAAPLIGGAQGHDDELAAGLRTTLARIRETVEGGLRR
jgi:hypothetical protein